MTDTSINNFNFKIRQAPWYQQWFQQRGLNPNNVKLNDSQRHELKRVVEVNTGFALPGDMKIDPAGNLNEKGGWAGLPTGVKIAILAGATLATAGAAGAFAGGAGAASGAASAGSVGSIAGGGAAAAGTAGTVGSIAGGAAAAGGGIGLSSVLQASLMPAIGMAGNYFANRANANAARDAATAQTNSANYAADLQFKSAEEQLAFLREQDALSRKEKAETDARNFGLYQEERDYDRGNYAAREARLQPYRNLGLGAIGQFSRPIQNIPQGSIGARMGGK